MSTPIENEIEAVKEAVLEWVRDAVSTHGDWANYVVWAERHAGEIGWTVCGVLASQLTERLHSKGLQHVVDCVYASTRLTDFVVYGLKRIFVRVAYSVMSRRFYVEVCEIVPRARVVL